MDRIKELIKQNGYTQEEFAQKLKITRSGLTKLLSGNPSLKTLEGFAQALNVPIWQLFTDPEAVQGARLTALVEHEGRFYKANTLPELEKIVETIREKQV